LRVLTLRTYFLHTCPWWDTLLIFVRLNNFKEGGGDNQNLPEASIEEALNDVEELASTNECYRQKGREETSKNPNSPSVSQRGTSVKTKPRSSGLEPRKTPAENSDDGGDKDPMKKNLEKYHVVYNPVKRKRETQKMRPEIPEIEESPLSYGCR
jgi:hypothetical protein